MRHVRHRALLSAAARLHVSSPASAAARLFSRSLSSSSSSAAAPAASLSASTLVLHGGASSRTLGAPVGGVPVLATSYYTHPDAVNFSSSENSADTPLFYSRWQNPTCELLERRLAALEVATGPRASAESVAAASALGPVSCVTFGSGMAAISGLFSNRLQQGDHLVLSSVCYAGVAEWVRTELPRRGITFSAVDTSNLAALRAVLQSHPNTKLVHIETPANPILKVSDVRAIAELTHAAGAELSVDATIATPLCQQPLLQGADFVCHSLSKYVCGHGDALGGAVIGQSDRVSSLRTSTRILTGGVLSAFSAFLMLRGLESLGARMRAHEAGARKVEAWLAAHPRVRRTLWTGSTRHPQHELAAAQMQAHSGLLSFSVKPDAAGRGTGPATARQLADRLRVVTYAVSLGAAKSLCFYIDTDAILHSSFHFSTPGEEAAYREWAGDGVFRLSVGLENPDDIIADLEQAMR